MGGSKSKVRKLNPRTISELQKNVDVDFTREEIEEWFKEYQSSLRKGMNKLTMKEFEEVYNSVFDGDASAFVQQLFRSFDMDKDGYLDFKEFIVGLCVSGSDNLETKLQWAFKMYDIDGNGSISREEMSSMLKAIYRMVSTDMSNSKSDIKTIEELVSSFFKSFDENQDDAISQEEFVTGAKTMPIILHLLQCNPDAEDDGEQINNFDSLDITDKPSTSKSKTQQTNSNGKGKTTSKGSHDRGSAYKTK
ncbi:Guanylate cyclase activator 1A [Mactra antiquata]